MTKDKTTSKAEAAFITTKTMSSKQQPVKANVIRLKSGMFAGVKSVRIMSMIEVLVVVSLYFKKWMSHNIQFWHPIKSGKWLRLITSISHFLNPLFGKPNLVLNPILKLSGVRLN